MSWWQELSSCDRCKLAWALILAGLSVGFYTWAQKRGIV